MPVAEAEKSATEKITGTPLVQFVQEGARERDRLAAEDKANQALTSVPDSPAPKVEAKTEAKPVVKAEAKQTDLPLAPDVPKVEAKPALTEAEKKDKQIKDTRDALTQERKDKLELKRQLAEQAEQLKVINAKLDGTYEDKKAPHKTDEQVKAESDYSAKIKLSEKNAKKKHGEEVIEEKITAKDSPYMVLEREKPWVGPRVGYSDDPIEEALQVLWEEDKFTEHKTRNWQDILEKEVQSALDAKRDELVKEATDQIQGKVKREPAKVRGLSEARGMTPGTEKQKPASPDAFLNKAFGHLKARGYD